MPAWLPNSSSRRRRGVAAVLIAVTTPVLFGLATLAIDVGLMYNAKADLQRAADAAALAGAAGLREGGVEVSRAYALDYVTRNLVLNDQVSVDPDNDIEFGQAKLNADGTSVQFLSGASPPNALRVTLHHELSLIFAGVFGKASSQISASATSAIQPRDFMLVIDCSGSMTKQSDYTEVAQDLDDLGIPYGPNPNDVRNTALTMTYEGGDPEFDPVYSVGDKFLPPSVRILPLKATKDAAAYSVTVVEDSGYDDLIGAVAYSSQLDWVEPLTTDYGRVRAKLRGATRYGGTKIEYGIRGAREELQSVRARNGTDKVIVLMTDGRSGDMAPVLQEAQLAADAGMTIHCIGLGLVEPAQLEAIAAAGGGGTVLYVENYTDESVYGPALQAVFESFASDEVGIGLIQ